MKKLFRLWFIVLAVCAYVTAGWVVGLVVLTLALVLLARDIVRLRRATARTTECPWCHASVDQYGAFSCRSCSQRVLGWAWRCSSCSAEHGHIECPACGLSVPNPMVPRR